MTRKTLLGWTAAMAACIGMAGGAAAQSPNESAAAAQVCLNHPTITRTKVLNGQNILFFTRDGQAYNNVLPRECPSLGRNSVISYDGKNGRLCATNLFAVLWKTGAGNNFMTAFTCQLGLFVPVSEAEVEDLVAATEQRRERRAPRTRQSRDMITVTPVERSSESN